MSLQVCCSFFLRTAPVWMYVVPLMAALVAYAPYDLRARAMMGDAGANPVGGGHRFGSYGRAVAGGSGIGRGCSRLAARCRRAGVALAESSSEVPALKYLDELGRD